LSVEDWKAEASRSLAERFPELRGALDDSEWLQEHFVHREGVLAYYWQHPDGDVEIHDVVLPEEHEGSNE
jgi:hypothetical protein